MKSIWVLTLLSLLVFFSKNNVWSQHSHNNEEIEYHNGLEGTSRLTIGIGHTHVSEGKIDGKTEWLTLPSWLLNYDYWLSNNWAIGLQNDIVLESFFFESGDNELLERSYPISSVPIVIYKPGKRLMFIAGVGVEFTSEETLTLTRLGFEYGFHIPNNWEIGVTLVWDNKWNYYNSWGIALTISKLL